MEIKLNNKDDISIHIKDSLIERKMEPFIEGEIIKAIEKYNYFLVNHLSQDIYNTIRSSYSLRISNAVTDWLSGDAASKLWDECVADIFSDDNMRKMFKKMIYDRLEINLANNIKETLKDIVDRIEALEDRGSPYS